MQAISAMEPDLPILREDLELVPGRPSPDGAPTWSIYDPVRHAYFSIGWSSFEMLAKWSLGKAALIAEAVNRTTPLDIGEKDVQSFSSFLRSNELTQPGSEADLASLSVKSRMMRQKPMQWLLKNYLMMRFPLVNPEPFLERTAPFVGRFKRWETAAALFILAVISLIMASRQAEAWQNTLSMLTTPSGALAMAAAVGIVKLLHELGHAYAAKLNGCRVPQMGISFMVMCPVLYTDTTDIYRLTTKRARIEIGIAGVAVELAVGTICLFAWNFTPPSAFRDVLFFMATTSWVLSLLVNLNPLMRFDGYYLFADLLGVDNLQTRAFALGKWALRKTLFGLDTPPPESQPAQMRRTLIVYAYAVWIYRFSLYLGIALLVYHAVFKLLGIVLLFVELWVFLVKPIYSELRHWLAIGRKVGWNRGTAGFLGLFLLIVSALAFPWRTQIEAPAVMVAQQTATIYSPRPGKIEAVGFKDGETVRAGQALVVLSTPELTLELTESRAKLQSLATRLARITASDDERRNASVLTQEFQTERAKEQSLMDELAKLTVTAPIDGRIHMIAGRIETGASIKGKTAFALIADETDTAVEAYVQETDLLKIGRGAKASFIPLDVTHDVIPLRVVDISLDRARTIEAEELTSRNGGPIAVETSGDRKTVPTEALYRIRLNTLSPQPFSGQRLRGYVTIESQRQSLLAAIFRHAASVLIRETGF